MVCNLVRVNKNLVNNQCDRLLCSLAFVEPTTLALLPVCRMPQASSMLVNRASTSPVYDELPLQLVLLQPI